MPMERKTKIFVMTTIPITARNFCIPIADILVRNGAEVVFGFSDGKEAIDIKNLGYRIKTVPISRNPFSIKNLLGIFLLASFLRRERFDIIETTTPVASVVGRIAAILAGVPIRINTIRGTFPEDTHRWQAALFYTSERILARFTTFTITINREDMEELITRGLVEKKKIMSVSGGGCGIDLQKFDINLYPRERRLSVRKELGLNEDDYVITYLGRLCTDKGIFDFIELIKCLAEDTSNIKGLIVGEPLQGEKYAIRQDEIRGLAQSLDIGDRIVLTGFREDVPALIAVTNVVVLPSKREGFGLILAEAAAMGKPAVAYSCRGTREAIEDGLTGYLIEQGNVGGMKDAISRLINNRVMEQEISKNAYSRARDHFDKKILIDEYERVYMKFLNRN
jgi:glycosyltransferase involved in cell wall biosynthesis